MKTSVHGQARLSNVFGLDIAARAIYNEIERQAVGDDDLTDMVTLQWSFKLRLAP